MSTLEFHGHALNTLISNGAIERLGAPFFIALVLAVSIIVGLLHQWGDTSFSVTVLCTGLVAGFVVTLTVLLFDRMWLPVTELTLAQCGLFVASIHGRALRSAMWTKNLVLRSSSRLERRGTSERFDIKNDAWTLIISMVNQTLDLNRALFFETRLGRKHLANAMAINCSFDDYLEMRRDFRRPPYVTAIEAGGPVRLENLLRVTGEPEDQYLVPLQSGGEILGFWVRRRPAALRDHEHAR